MAGFPVAGMPAAFADALAAVDAGMAGGGEDAVGTAVPELTGRPARTFAEFVRDHADEWAPARPPGR